ncbi:histidine phosphotransferase family protein [Citreimonas sp.]|uniref:histidine phosphotransferase family protein n=1 Tax=Citreimonas sp. TaxID=3036715 RepID=UPI004058D669
MTDHTASLAALVGSRLCHDLISPIGAIQNGLELVALAGGAETGAEMALIQDSCDSASARIKFFRVAFGSANDGQSIGSRDAAATLEAITRTTRMTAQWAAADKMARANVQLAYLAFLCCESALPLGGTVAIEGGDSRIRVEATGRRVAIHEGAWSFLAGGGHLDDLTPDKVQFALLSTLVRDRGRTLSARPAEDRIEITIG